MAFAESLGSFFDVAGGFATPCTVQGVAAAGIYDEATELALGEALVVAPTLLLPATVAAAEGGAVTVSGPGSFRVRQVLKLPPDGVLQRLVLARD